MQYRECYSKGAQRLKEAGVPEADLDARLLLEFVCGTNRNDLLVHGEREVDPEKVAKYGEMLEIRGKRIPLQHILGEQEFMGLSFVVNENVLIPRQDTEILVEQALKILKPGMQILDMCTGSGCILISLLALSKERSDVGSCGNSVADGCDAAGKACCSGVGVDLSEKALEVARINGQRLLAEGQDMANLEQDMQEPCQSGKGAQIQWLHSDLFEKVTGSFDVIVSNPPYIPTKVVEGLMPEVRDHEPMMALDGMEDGLFFYRKITSQSEKFLKPGGYLFFEIGHDQGDDVEKLLIDNNFTEVKVIQDYAGLDRVVCGKRKE